MEYTPSIGFSRMIGQFQEISAQLLFLAILGANRANLFDVVKAIRPFNSGYVRFESHNRMIMLSAVLLAVINVSDIVTANRLQERNNVAMSGAFRGRFKYIIPKR